MSEEMIGRMRYFTAANEEAVARLLEEWQGDYPEMGILALVAEPDREHAVPLLQQLCCRMQVPLRGGVFPALLTDEGFPSNGFLLLRFDVMPFAEIYTHLHPTDPLAREATERLAADVIRELSYPRESTLFLIFDAMVSNIGSILDELYLRVADRVRYMGVNAGSETFQPMPCLFDNSRIAQDGVLAILLPHHPGAVVEHCYHAPERMICATATEGNRIITIDWRPAFDIYREAAEAEYGVLVNRENFYQLAVHFPFGIIRANNEIIVRMPVALEDDGSIFCVGEVPPNALLTLLRAPAVDSLQTVEKLAQGLSTLCGPLTGADLLTFYCAGRRIHLGEQARDELLQLKRKAGPACMAGALSLGEIGHSMQWGYPYFHNGAVVCCRWGS